MNAVAATTEFQPDIDGEEIEQSMSNFDHSIDDGMAEALQAAPRLAIGRHSAWNFHALVWFEAGQFHSEVWCYRSPVSRHKADTLQELMKIHNAQYGAA